MHFNLLQIVDKTTSDINITFLLFSFITAQVSALAILALFVRFPAMKKKYLANLIIPKQNRTCLSWKVFLTYQTYI